MPFGRLQKSSNNKDSYRIIDPKSLTTGNPSSRKLPEAKERSGGLATTGSTSNY